MNLSDRFRRKDSLAFYSSLAAEKGGKLLTAEEPKNSHQMLEWECARSHRWKAKANNIQNGKWCPTCSSGIGERICRIYFETLWGESFPSTWPDWLQRKGKRRQLDGYCEKLGIAFEHQGQQHYKKMKGSKFQRVTVERQIEEDRYKMEVCTSRNVRLFQIPEIPTLTAINDVKSVIKRQCEHLGLPIPLGFDEKMVDLRKAWDYDLMDRLREAACARGGICLGKDFVGISENYLWECEKGHQWEASGGSIIYSKSWCPTCHHEWLSRRIQTGICKLPVSKPDPVIFEKMKEAARERSGQLMDEVYIGVRKNYRWQCRQGHTWTATGDNILRSKSWCPLCARIRPKL